MKVNQRKIYTKKKYVITVLFCVFVIFTMVLVLFRKNRSGDDIVAIYVKKQGSDYIFTSRDDGQSWVDGNVPVFFMTTQEKEIRRNKENITVTIQNKSYDIMTYGEEFYLYRWLKNTWVPYEMTKPSEYELTFNQIEYLLQPDTFCDLKCNLQYYDFKRGKYMLKKSVMFEKDDSEWDLSVEFVVD